MYIVENVSGVQGFKKFITFMGSKPFCLDEKYYVYDSPYDAFIDLSCKDQNDNQFRVRFYQIIVDDFDSKHELWNRSYAPILKTTLLEPLNGCYWFSQKVDSCMNVKVPCEIRMYFRDGYLYRDEFPKLSTIQFESKMFHTYYFSNQVLGSKLYCFTYTPLASVDEFHEKSYLEFCKLFEIGCNDDSKWNKGYKKSKKNKKRNFPPAFTSDKLWEPHLAGEIFSYTEHSDYLNEKFPQDDYEEYCKSQD